MERMFASVIVVQHDVHDLVFLQYVSVGVTTVDGNVRGIGASSEGAVQRRDDRRSVGDVVEEGTDAIVSISVA